MTRRPIPFSGSAFFFGLRLRRAGRGALRADATPRGKDRPLRQRLAGQKGSARPRAEGPRSTRPRSDPRPGPAPRERDRLSLRTARKAARAGARRCAPRGLTRIQRTFEQTGAAVLLVSDSLLAPVPKVALSTHRSTLRLSPFPLTRPRHRARGQKKAPEARGKT